MDSFNCYVCVACVVFSKSFANFKGAARLALAWPYPRSCRFPLQSTNVMSIEQKGKILDEIITGMTLVH